jgi:putative ABC transport system permease protein
VQGPLVGVQVVRSSHGTSVKALNRKLLRDLTRMWSQALTIALVVASAVAGFLTTLSAVASLSDARDRFYEQGRFADVFASVRRAPLSLLPVLQAVPGVALVQATVERPVRLRIEGLSDPLMGHLVGMDPRRPRELNRIVLRSGMADDASMSPGRTQPDGAIPAWVSEAFADAHALKPGARLQAVINGRQRDLVVRGVALSPEYVFAGMFGMPDPRGFGVFWVDAEVLAAVWDMEGAFTRLAFRLAPGADERRVISALKPLLQRYGGRDPHGREHQGSHAMLDNEIAEQRVIGTVLPAIFLGVAAFLLNVVVSRMVATQREQIAALKALGYANRALAVHYLGFVLLVVAAGSALGVALGKGLGLMFTGLYAEFFRFPAFEHRLPPELVLMAIGITVATAVLGTLHAIRATARLAPAEAMRPPAPAHYRRTLLERLGLTRLPTALRMILRQLERRPWRSTLAVAGVAAAVAIVVLGNFFRDAIGHIVERQFNVAMRADVQVWMLETTNDTAAQALARAPGVFRVESTRQVAVDLVHGARRQRVQIRGLDTDAQLNQVIDAQGRVVRLVGQGLVLTDRLADKLGLRVGDTVQAEVLEGRPRILTLTVDATVQETMGLNATMERTALNRALGEGDVAGGFSLGVERGREAELLEATREMPRVGGAFSKATLLRNMEQITARNIRIMSTVMTVFAAVIAVGVVYNNARIALSERAWELASLRVLGFTRGEVSALLLGELALLIAVALPLGMLAGWGLVHLLSAALKTDQFHFPVVILPRTYAWAAVCVVLAGVGSALVVRRRIDQLDMVAALKTRE